MVGSGGGQGAYRAAVGAGGRAPVDGGYPGSVTFPVVGMVGGGQLARMTHEAGIPLGLRFKLLSDTPQDSAAQVVSEVVIGDYRDLDTLRDFARGCDVITFDHEHVPIEHLRALEADGIPVRPGPDALVHAQDKGVMRARLTELGAPARATASWPIRRMSRPSRPRWAAFPWS